MPAIDPELTAACLESLDPEFHPNILLVDNTARGLDVPAVGWKVQPGWNIGVAASWNVGARHALRTGVDLLWLMSTSIQFRDGGQAWVSQMDDADDVGLGTIGLGWHLHGFRTDVFRTVGLFDEAFYPAYYEDNDFLYRMHLAGLPSPPYDGQSWPYVWAVARSEGNAQALTRGFVTVGSGPREYYVRKWGGAPGFERYKMPFCGEFDLSWCPTTLPDGLGSEVNPL